MLCLESVKNNSYTCLCLFTGDNPFYFIEIHGNSILDFLLVFQFENRLFIDVFSRQTANGTSTYKVVFNHAPINY